MSAGVVIEHFLPMQVPTKTHQQKRAKAVGGKVIFYEDATLKDVREKFTAYLAQYAPSKPIEGPIALTTVWLFEIKGKHKSGEWKTTKPDTGNSVKLFQDVLTACGYWLDDSQVVSETHQKFWSDKPGIYFKIEKLGE